MVKIKSASEIVFAVAYALSCESSAMISESEIEKSSEISQFNWGSLHAFARFARLPHQ